MESEIYYNLKTNRLCILHVTWGGIYLETSRTNEKINIVAANAVAAFGEFIGYL